MNRRNFLSVITGAIVVAASYFEAKPIKDYTKQRTITGRWTSIGNSCGKTQLNIKETIQLFDEDQPRDSVWRISLSYDL